MFAVRLIERSTVNTFIISEGARYVFVKLAHLIFILSCFCDSRCVHP